MLAHVSAATPKIADYPFTTLTPNLGVVDLSPNQRFVIADVPGLIEGASEGLGLGMRFLGHLERTSVLIHLIDATAEDPVEAWRVIRGELAAYGEGVEDKPELIALNKVDALDPATRKATRLGAQAGVRREALPGLRRLGRRHPRTADRRPCPDRARRKAPEEGTRRDRGLAAVNAVAAAQRLVDQDRLGPADRRGTAARPTALGSASLGADLARLTARGQKVVIVSSGAVALGRGRLGLGSRALTLSRKAGRRRRRPVAADAGLGRGAGAARHDAPRRSC